MKQSLEEVLQIDPETGFPGDYVTHISWIWNVLYVTSADSPIEELFTNDDLWNILKAKFEEGKSKRGVSSDLATLRNHLIRIVEDRVEDEEKKDFNVDSVLPEDKEWITELDALVTDLYQDYYEMSHLRTLNQSWVWKWSLRTNQETLNAFKSVGQRFFETYEKMFQRLVDSNWISRDSMTMVSEMRETILSVVEDSKW